MQSAKYVVIIILDTSIYSIARGNVGLDCNSLAFTPSTWLSFDQQSFLKKHQQTQYSVLFKSTEGRAQFQALEG
jgi:hypothetical protein